MISDLLLDIQKQNQIHNTEVIVVDNGSTDQTYEELSNNKAIDKLIRLDKNIGCAGRNEGISRAASEYVITLDDDVFFNRNDEIERIITFFNKNTDAHAVNFKILYPDTKEIIPFNWYHPRDFKIYYKDTFLTDYISEGAVAFRKYCFAKTGYYPEEFFLSHEGPDLAYRFINKGYNIYYTGDIDVLHKCSKEQRTTWRNVYYDTRNYFWLLIRNYPVNKIIFKCIFRLITTMIFAMSRKQFKWYISGIKDSFLGLTYHYKKRELLTKSSIEKIKTIRKQQPKISNRCIEFISKIKAMNKEYK